MCLCGIKRKKDKRGEIYCIKNAALFFFFKKNVEGTDGQSIDSAPAKPAQPRLQMTSAIAAGRASLKYLRIAPRNSPLSINYLLVKRASEPPSFSRIRVSLSPNL